MHRPWAEVVGGDEKIDRTSTPREQANQARCEAKQARRASKRIPTQWQPEFTRWRVGLVVSCRQAKNKHAARASESPTQSQPEFTRWCVGLFAHVPTAIPSPGPAFSNRVSAHTFR